MIIYADGLFPAANGLPAYAAVGYILIIPDGESKKFIVSLSGPYFVNNENL